MKRKTLPPMPDGRSEYPLHLYQDQGYPINNRLDELIFFECKTYSKDGTLLKTEMRPPIDSKDLSGKLRSLDRLFSGNGSTHYGRCKK
jgi:hypothetical protein